MIVAEIIVENETKGINKVFIEQLKDKIEKEWDATCEMYDEDGNTQLDNISKNTMLIVSTKDGYELTIKVDNSNQTAELIQVIKEQNTVTQELIIYNLNGGSGQIEAQTIDNRIITDKVPTKENYTFIGWGTEKNATTISYTAGNVYNSNSPITLYAIWIQNIEYLESNGMQYIDTEFNPNQNTSIEFVAEKTEDTTGINVGWFGARNGTDLESNGAFLMWESNNNFRPFYANTLNSAIVGLTIQPNTKYVVYQNKNETYINNNKYLTSTMKDFQSMSNLTLCGVKTYQKRSTNQEDSIDCRMSKLKIYSCKIWDNSNLVRDYIPVKDFNGINCLYDKKNNKFYYLIQGIHQIQYIESTGTQYIDTQVYPNQDTSIEFVAEKTQDTSGIHVAWYGSRKSNSATDGNAFLMWETNNNFRPFYANTLNSAITGLTIQPNTKYVVYQNKNITNINGVNYLTTTYDNFSSPTTLTLFALKTYTETNYNTANSIDSRTSKLKLYSCKIWDNGNLIRDYIPIKDVKGTVALYDKVNKLIYYNSGTGNFIEGN